MSYRDKPRYTFDPDPLLICGAIILIILAIAAFL